MLAHCLAKPGAWPDNPWEHEHPVIKVGEGERGKIFAFLGAGSLGVKAGATREEILETLSMAIYMGAGPSMIYAAEALRAFDELSPSQEAQA